MFVGTLTALRKCNLGKSFKQRERWKVWTDEVAPEEKEAAESEVGIKWKQNAARCQWHVARESQLQSQKKNARSGAKESTRREEMPFDPDAKILSNQNTLWLNGTFWPVGSLLLPEYPFPPCKKSIFFKIFRYLIKNFTTWDDQQKNESKSIWIVETETNGHFLKDTAQAANFKAGPGTQSHEVAASQIWK